MGVLSENAIIGASAAGGYDIDYSCRFEDGDTAYMQRTPSSAGNRKTWTWSSWVKRGNLGSVQNIFVFGAANTDQVTLALHTDKISFSVIDGNTTTVEYVTTQVLRDLSAWYHIVVSGDTSLGSPLFKVYLNGSQVTAFSTSTNSAAQNLETAANNTVVHTIGNRGFSSAQLYDGYLAEVHWIDGTALDASSFGETDSLTNEWKAIKYAGTYGNEGFYLKFEDAANLGNDSSGNGNDFTSSGLAASDQTIDTPQNSTGGSFATFNPLITATQEPTLSEGNLQCVSTSGTYGYFAGATIGVSSGKWYAEYYHKAGGGGNVIGIMPYNMKNAGTGGNYIGSTANTGTGYYGGGQIFNYDNAGNVDSGPATFDTGDLIGVALDLDDSDGKVYFYKNGTLQDTGLTNDAGNNYNLKTVSTNWTFGCALNANWTNVANFGQDSSFAGNKTAQGNSDGNSCGDFYYSPPSGYLALCSNNLPDPAIALPEEHFTSVLYTGTGSARSITGVGFQPDLVWTKARTKSASNGGNNWLLDSVRGVQKEISSDSNAVEGSDVNSLTAFGADGYSLGSSNGFNYNGDTFVSWNWKAGGTAVSNTDGSITSSVSANPTAGFSIVGYTSPGTNADGTVGHGLSQAPEMVMAKNLDSAYNWDVYTPALSSGYDLILNSTAAQGSGRWSTTIPTASLVTLKNTYEVNGTDDYIAYCFHSVEGYSKVGSYDGNSVNGDGPFLYTDFTPAFVIIKMIEPHTYDWIMFDNKRSPYNVVNKKLYPNLNSVSGTGTYLDFVSNGIKIRDASYDINHSSSSYIYIAFAESPFKTSRAR